MLLKFFEEKYSFSPLSYAADVSQCAVAQALSQLNIDLDNEYVLFVNNNELSGLFAVCAGVKLTAKIDTTLKNISFYVVDPKNKQIIYSPGA